MARKPAAKKTPVNDLIAKPPGAPAVIPDAEPIGTPVAETPVRKTVTPKPAAAARKTPAPLTYERIAERAYYISQSPSCRSEFDNWLQAEGELKSEA